jgi:hypothetical protein
VGVWAVQGIPEDDVEQVGHVHRSR